MGTRKGTRKDQNREPQAGVQTDAPGNKSDATQEPAPNDGNESPSESPQSKAKTGNPRDKATEQASKEPLEDAEAKKTTQPAEAAPTTRRVREASRTTGGRDNNAGEAHATEPPATANSLTTEKAEIPGKTPRPDSEKAEKQRTDEIGNAPAKAADKTKESQPDAHPTERDAPDPTNAAHTSETNGAKSTERERPPATEKTVIKYTPLIYPLDTHHYTLPVTKCQEKYTLVLFFFFLLVCAEDFLFRKIQSQNHFTFIMPLTLPLTLPSRTAVDVGAVC
jgi:hypothetical protein